MNRCRYLTNRCNITIHFQDRGSHLEVRDDGIVHVLFLLAEKLCGHAVQTVRAELVVAEHVGQHVEHDASVDGGFHVLAFTVRAALESRVPVH